MHARTCMCSMNCLHHNHFSTVDGRGTSFLLLPGFNYTCFALPRPTNVTWQFCFPVTSDVGDVTLRDVMCYVNALYTPKVQLLNSEHTDQNISHSTNKLEHIHLNVDRVRDKCSERDECRHFLSRAKSLSSFAFFS